MDTRVDASVNYLFRFTFCWECVSVLAKVRGDGGSLSRDLFWPTLAGR
jgi:hypothetical protein